MFDFHININKALTPAKAIQVAKMQGLRAFALFYSCDYLFDFEQVDFCNITAKQKKEIINSNYYLQKLLQIKQQIHTLSIYYDVQAFFGIKLSFIPPALLEENILAYRALGFNLIGVHGESIFEPVEIGTNFAACNARPDILFNPGLIDAQTAEIAGKNNIFLEISTHQSHAYSNAHIVKLAKEFQAKMIIGSNANSVKEIYSHEIQKLIVKGACINLNDLNNHELYTKLR